MSAAKTVTLYLHQPLRRQAENGNHNFLAKVTEVLRDAALTVAYDGDDTAARLRAASRPGYSLFLMQEPVNTRSLTFRKTYLYPFWHIEKQAARWDWPVAAEVFDPAKVEAHKAANFFRYWRQRLFEEAHHDVSENGFVYVPLQGRLLQHRSFQSCSPIEMVETVLTRDPSRRVIATLHPSETYSEAEMAALEKLLASHDQLTVEMGSATQHLQYCDYIVTQNSSVGFRGYFLEKPLILFGKSDFHHIALDGTAPDVFDQIAHHRPNYAAYLYWFLQLRAINAGRPEAKKRIRNVLRGHGWPV